MEDKKLNFEEFLPSFDNMPIFWQEGILSPYFKSHGFYKKFKDSNPKLDGRLETFTQQGLIWQDKGWKGIVYKTLLYDAYCQMHDLGGKNKDIFGSSD